MSVAKLPKYTTTSCPINQTERMERSAALNCRDPTRYICLPNEHFTELLEFCFPVHARIRKGKKKIKT